MFKNKKITKFILSTFVIFGSLLFINTNHSFAAACAKEIVDSCSEYGSPGNSGYQCHGNNSVEYRYEWGCSATGYCAPQYKMGAGVDCGIPGCNSSTGHCKSGGGGGDGGDGGESCPTTPMKERECCLGNTFWCDDDIVDPPEYTYTLVTKKTGTGTGTVTSSPGGISCGASCSTATTSNTGNNFWTLTASASASSTFGGWSEPQSQYCTDSDKNGCNSYANTCGNLSTCRVTVGANSEKTVTARFNLRTLTASLAASPTSGITNQTTYTFTPSRTGGTATGTITYSNPQCGTGGTRTSWTASTGRFTCTYSSSGTKTARVTLTQGGVTATPTRNVTVTGPTVTASLAASPTSGITNQTTYTFTPSRTGGTATGTITYSNPQCGTGGTRTSWTASTGRFTCTYSSAGTKTASVTMSQGGAAATPTRSVTVTAPTLTASLAVNPTSGSGTTQTTYTFTPSRTGGTATGTITYSNPQCGTGGTRTSWTASTGRFTCTYSSSGTKTASVTVSQGGAAATPTRSVTVSTPTISATLGVNSATGYVGDEFTFTPSRTGGTATGTITYSNPQCGTGGTRTSWTASTGRFTCTYSSSGTKTARVTLTQGGVTATPTRNVTVSHRPPEITSFGPLNSPIEYGNSISLMWLTKYVASCSGDDFVTGGLANGSAIVGPLTSKKEYTITCRGLNGSDVSRKTEVEVYARRPIITLEADPTWVRAGDNVTIEWSISNATSCNLTENGSTVSGVNPLQGGGVGSYEDGPINQVTTYRIDCRNTGPDLVESTNYAEVRVNILPIYGEF